MTMSFNTRLVRLAEHLGELRFRLQDAARGEVAHAIADALADAARAFIAGEPSERGTGRSAAAYGEPSEWDDPWSDAVRFTAASVEAPVASAQEPFHFEAALASALAIARWSVVRTGQPLAAIGLATAALLVLFLARERLKSLVNVAALTHELLSFSRRPL